MIRFKSTHFTRNAFENGFPIGYPWLNFPMYMYMSYIYHIITLVKQEMFQKHTCPPPPMVQNSKLLLMYKALLIWNFAQGRTKH